MTELTVRPPTLADVEAVAELGRASEIAVFGESEFTEDDLVDEWRRLDIERDAWLVLANDRIGGYAMFEARGGGRLLSDGYVHPELTGRGIGARLLELAEKRAGEEAERIPAGERVYLQSGVLSDDRAAAELHERRGYRPVRHFFRMVIDMDEPPPGPEPLDRVRVETFDTERDAVAVHEALEEAFAEEFEHRPHSFDEFRTRLIENERFDPGLWFVARDGDEVAGAIVCTWKRWDAGWIDSVGVRKPWRGRGIGMALLRTAFGEFYRRGERRCALGVDADNTTGATRLYERAGMRVFWEAVIYEKELVPA
jgi:mycothiol synthase